MQKILVIPDCHHPYVDKRAWKILLAAARLLKPEVIVVLGDFVDFYSVSDHDKDPKRVRLLDVEVEAAKTALSELDAIGATRKYYIAGNHEDRLSRYLMRKAPELFNLVKLEEILELKARGWRYVPYRDYVTVGAVQFTHDLGKAGRFAAHNALSDAQASIVIGHLHRFSYVIEGDAFGKKKVAMCPGWLGDPAQADYMHKLKANRDWAQGFAYGYMLPNGIIHFVPVPIVQHRAIVEGKLLTG